MQNYIRLLLVEDDLTDVDSIVRTASAIDFKCHITHAVSLKQAVEFLSDDQFDVILTDLGLPDSQGIATVARLQSSSGSVPVIVLTGGSVELGPDVIRAGASDFVPKDEVKTLLIRTIRYAIERFEAKNALLQTNAKLEEQNRKLAAHCEASKQFVDNVSHEFRTPLTAIKEYASIVRDGIDGPVNQCQVNRINTLINRTDDLARMVDDLLETSQLGLGLMRVFASKHRLRCSIDDVVLMLETRANLKGISVQVEDLPEATEVYCDEEKLRRILTNLITNAIKFTHAGGEIRISSRVEGDYIATTVSDNGIGIPEDQLERIFERFKQVGETSRTPGVKGFGLGLNIANALTVMNLGKLEVESEEGRGSKFTFFLPRANVASILGCYLDQRGAVGSATETIAVVRINASFPIDPKSEFSPEEKMQLGRLVRINHLVSSVSTNKDLVIRTEQDCWVVYISTETNSSEKVINQIETAYDGLKLQKPTVSYPDLTFNKLGEFQLGFERSILEELGDVSRAIV